MTLSLIDIENIRTILLKHIRSNERKKKEKHLLANNMYNKRNKIKSQ
jgi:hypothetical protein